MVEEKRFTLENFKGIFREHWEEFLKQYPEYEKIGEVVEKMLGCGDEKVGYIEYICPCCQKRKKVAFS